MASSNQTETAFAAMTGPGAFEILTTSSQVTRAVLVHQIPKLSELDFIVAYWSATEPSSWSGVVSSRRAKGTRSMTSKLSLIPRPGVSGIRR